MRCQVNDVQGGKVVAARRAFSAAFCHAAHAFRTLRYLGASSAARDARVGQSVDGTEVDMAQ